MSGLAGYPDEELQAELRRRKAARKPVPAFRCEKCGEVGYFRGHFSASLFEIQRRQFDDAHERCLPLYGGGGI